MTESVQMGMLFLVGCVGCVGIVAAAMLLGGGEPSPLNTWLAQRERARERKHEMEMARLRVLEEHVRSDMP